MKKLKEILDEFGWERLQDRQLPPEIKPEADNFVQKTHTYDLYALNGVCVIVEDGTNIVELSAVAKTSHGSPYSYERRAQIPTNTVVKVENPAHFLEGFRHLHSFSNRFIFVREENMHFEGIGKRMEEAGELYKDKNK
jgi:hypothetical protein